LLTGIAVLTETIILSPTAAYRFFATAQHIDTQNFFCATVVCNF